MNAAMDSDLRVDRLSPSIGGWPALSLRGDEDVPNNRSDSAYLTRGVAIDGRRPNECPYARPVWQLPDRAESWFVEGDQGISPRLVKGHPDLGKGSVRSQRLTFWCSSIVRIGRRPVTAPAVEVGVPPTDPCYPPARVEANACGLGKHGLHHVDPRASACARRGGVSSRQRTRRERHRGKRGKRAQHRCRYERPAFLHSSSLLRFGLGVVAPRPRPCASDDVEREIDREVDPVRLPGVLPDRIHAGGFVGSPNLVPAVAAECLVSEHVAADTPEARLEAR